MKIVYIYTLEDNNGVVRYVGKTEKPKTRFNSHKSLKSNKTSYLKSWIISLSNKGEIPKMNIIDECLLIDWEFWEKHYISLYKSWGFRLTNLTIGGEGSSGYRHTEESKDKMRRNKKDISGVNNPNYGKYGQDSSSYGYKHTDRTKEILRIKNTGVNNPNYGKKISKEKRDIIGEKLGSKIVVNDITYNSIRQMCLLLDVSRGVFKYRLKTNKITIQLPLVYNDGKWSNLI